MYLSMQDAQRSEMIYGYGLNDAQANASDPILNEAVCMSFSVSAMNECSTVSDTSKTWVSTTAPSRPSMVPKSSRAMVAISTETADHPFIVACT